MPLKCWLTSIEMFRTAHLWLHRIFPWNVGEIYMEFVRNACEIRQKIMEGSILLFLLNFAWMILLGLRSYMLLIWRTGIIFQIRNWLNCLTAFEIHHHFIMRWYFSIDVLCVKEHEHWYSGISSEFIMHNTRVIGLQIASKETRKRLPYCIFGVIDDVKCTWSDSKEKVHHVQRQSLKISKERWIFCLTAFDCSRLGPGDIPIMIRWVDQWNLKTSWTLYMYIFECSRNSC